MNPYVRLVLSLFLWVPYSALALAMDILGILVIPVLAARRMWVHRRSQEYGDGRTISAWEPRWAWVWGNEEDGLAGPAWYFKEAEKRGWSLWRQTVTWSAFRNPSNNLRFVKWLNPRIKPGHIRVATLVDREKFDAYLIWQGVFSGLLVFFTFRGQTFRFWWGWKLKPEDALGIDVNDYRFPRCGFARQLKRI